MIKAVLFDYGGVLTEGGKVGGIPEVLGALYEVDPDEIRIGDLHEKLIIGSIDDSTFFEELNKRFGSTKKIDTVSFNASNQTFMTPCEEVYGLAARLRAAGIKTGIGSNIYAMSADRLRAAGLYDNFDPVILSCTECVAKPDRAFFEQALQKLGLPGSEVLFIDDQQRFMPPEDLGMHTILAVSPQQIVADTEALIRKENGIEL